MPSDNSQPDIFTTAANGPTAGSYFTDGRWNLGGWATYPSADELALNAATPPPPASPENIRK